MNDDYKYSPILITGCARSGTSLTAGVINKSGAFGGQLAGPNPFNQKGMFENPTIRNDIVKPYLRSIKADPLGQKPLPSIDAILNVTKDQVDGLRYLVLSTIESQGYTSDNQWFYKGAKMCLIWPIWHLAFPDARWIIVRRASEDIVRSCLRTAFMRAYNGVVGWMSWVDAHKERFIDMLLNGLNIRMVWTQSIIDGDYTEIESVVNYLGLQFDEEVVREFVDPNLWGKP